MPAPMLIPRAVRRNRRRLISMSAVLGVALLAAGCGTSRETTGSVNRSGPVKGLESMSSLQLNETAHSLGKAYTRDTKDSAVALRYANVLQMQGNSAQALAVMRKLVIDHPKDRAVLAAYGKALAAVGQFEPALDAVRRAQTPEYPDWKLVSAEAAILDQMGETNAARQLYRKALDLQPNEPSILSNLGMSYVLQGDLKTAETYLRDASNQPGADSRVRQNLALVVGLQGRFQEAQEIASRELSPQQAEANMAYLRQMMAQQNAWNQIKADDEGKPSTN